MNKSIKKLLLFVAILVVAIVIISAVYLLLLAPGDDSGESPAPSGSASAPASPSPSESAAVQTEPPSPTDEGFTREETADGTIFHMTVPDERLAYAVTIEQIFDLADTNGRFLFQAEADGHGYLEFSFIEASKAAELAPSFLDSYLDYKEFEQSGANYIGSTEITGEKVTVNDGAIQLEAWLVDTDNGVLAVVISYSLSDKEVQKAELVKILDTLVIEA